MVRSVIEVLRTGISLAVHSDIDAPIVVNERVATSVYSDTDGPLDKSCLDLVTVKDGNTVPGANSDGCGDAARVPARAAHTCVGVIIHQVDRRFVLKVCVGLVDLAIAITGGTIDTVKELLGAKVPQGALRDAIGTRNGVCGCESPPCVARRRILVVDRCDDISAISPIDTCW